MQRAFIVHERLKNERVIDHTERHDSLMVFSIRTHAPPSYFHIVHLPNRLVESKQRYALIIMKMLCVSTAAEINHFSTH